LLGGAATQAIGAPLTVVLADLGGLAAMLAMTWTQLRGRLIPGAAGRGGGRGRPIRVRYERRLLTKLSAMELPSPPSSGITIQAHR
jgi:hypothetical protein